MSEAKEVKKPPKKRINVRRPEVMAMVEKEVQSQYNSSLVEKVKSLNGGVTIGNTTVVLAQEFGFCYGVERAIDLAYASKRVFENNRIFLIGEIIHNPEVNQQLADMGIVSLPWTEMDEQYDQLTSDDVVIVPAFGAPVHFMEKLQQQQVHIVDTTCGDVMKVWRRVKNYAKEGITSIIHGKASHEETRATASRALGEAKDGNYLVILTISDTNFLVDYLTNGGDREEFLNRFQGRYSAGFDPDKYLDKIGVANQTTMLKSETESIQRKLREAIVTRDGDSSNFKVFDTICGATQDRQDALFHLLKKDMNALFVVGGYNSSNTTHLVEIGQEELPTFFIRNASNIESIESIIHFDIEQKTLVSRSYSKLLELDKKITIGITAGASCPNNLIESTMVRIFELRGITKEQVLKH